MVTPLHLAFNLTFADLYAHEGLSKLDSIFVAEIAKADTELHNRFMAARASRDQLAAKDESQLLIDLAPYVEEFIGILFGISEQVKAMTGRHRGLNVLYECKRLFVQRRAIKTYKAEEASSFNGLHLQHELETFFYCPLSEQSFAEHVMAWLEDPETENHKLDLAARYAAWALFSEEGQHKHKEGVLFKSPKKLDFAHLVPVETIIIDGVTVMRLPEHDLRRREGFALTDAGANLELALDNANYCIYCHNQGKDSCSKGLKEKDGGYKKSTFDVTLAGCPLEEKISEMNMLKSQGYSIGALSVVTID
jgi:hypothetical protein